VEKKREESEEFKTDDDLSSIDRLRVEIVGGGEFLGKK